MPGTVNDYTGNDPSTWRTGIPTYGRIVYHDVYPGVDVSYYGRQGQLEYDWTVQPGADPQAIALDVQGVQGLRLTPQGALAIQTPLGELVQAVPSAYQTMNGQRHPVAVGYTLTGPATVGVTLGAYDTSQPLVIDPVLRYGTYLGGGNADVGRGIAVDASGAAYVAGYTASTDFPHTLGAYAGGSYDAFVAKLNASGTALLYSTYLGGSGEDEGYALALDGAGNVDVTGRTYSKDFPLQGAFQTTPPAPGGNIGFVSQLTSAGLLHYSSYVNGNGYGIAVDGRGNAYVVGITSGGLVTTAGADHTAVAGSLDGFVVKVNPSASGASSLVYGLPGRELREQPCTIAVDGAGRLTQCPDDPSTDYPTTAGAYGGRSLRAARSSSRR